MMVAPAHTTQPFAKTQDTSAQCPSSRPPHKGMSLTLTEEWAREISPAVERAVKYVWDDKTADWETRRVKIIMEESPFKEGGMRIAHKAWEINGDKMVAGVAKYFKEREISSNMCFNEAMTQMLADDYALRFNEALQTHRQIRFVPVTILRLSERSGQIVSFEPFLGGKYVKHNDNDGHVDTADELPQAFSHFTWEGSDRKLLVCDIQGVDDFYTDPQIHSADGEGFGSGNMGLAGIRKFFATHKCNGVCHALRLKQVDVVKSPSRSESMGDEYELQESRTESGNSFARDLSKALERGRAGRRTSISSDDGGDSSLSAAGGRAASRKKAGKLTAVWSTGKAFGKALIGAVKASMHSPPTSRSISPAARSPTGAVQTGGSGELALAPPQAFRGRRRRMSGEAGRSLSIPEECQGDAAPRGLPRQGGSR